jgi:large repetitive protein
MKLLVPKTAAIMITAAAALLAVPAMASAAPLNAAAKHSSRVSVSASPRVAVAGTTVKLSATVSSANPKPGGSVTFWWGSRKLCSAKLVNRSGHCYTAFRTAGNYGVRGVYSGDAKHSGATGHVTVVASKAGTSTKLSVSTLAPTVGQRVTFKAAVSSHSPLAVGGWVHMNVGSTTLCSASVIKGIATCGYTWKTAGGSYYVTASYLGDGAHSASASATSGAISVKKYATTTTITSIAPNDVAAGTPLTVTVTVASPAGAPAATGTVAVAPTAAGIAGLPGYSCTATLSGGTGTCTITPPVGSYGFIFYDATYSGDATHAGSKYTGMYQVTVPDTTTTAVTFAPTGGTVGTPDTITATVTNQAGDNISSTAGGTGTVTFTIGGTAIAGCSAVPLTYSMTTGNTATCSYTPTAVGSVTVTAAYSGDPDNLKSTGTGSLTSAA